MIRSSFDRASMALRRCVFGKVICTILIVLVSLGSAAADESDPKNSNIIPGSIASNQPIEVDVADLASSTDHTEQPVAQESQAPPIDSKSTDAASGKTTTYAGSTLVRRGRDSVESESQPIRDQRPWYRSTLFSLSVVLALMGAVYWGVRKLVPSLRAPQRSELIRVLARTALTPKQHVALVQCGRRLVLVGVSPERMDTLSEFTDVTEVAEVTANETAGLNRNTGSGGTFGHWFEKERANHTEPAITTPELEKHESASASPRFPSVTARPPLKELLERVRSLNP